MTFQPERLHLFQSHLGNVRVHWPLFMALYSELTHHGSIRSLGSFSFPLICSWFYLFAAMISTDPSPETKTLHASNMRFLHVFQLEHKLFSWKLSCEPNTCCFSTGEPQKAKQESISWDVKEDLEAFFLVPRVLTEARGYERGCRRKV